MSKLFQNAKASLRLDVRFAASPTGSLDSRLPTSPEFDSHVGNLPDTSEVLPETPDEIANTPSRTASRSWRHSRAPGFIAQIGNDVREPFPEGSPQLPAFPSIDHQVSADDAIEPPSSGFVSPVDSISRPDGPFDHAMMSSPLIHKGSIDQAIKASYTTSANDVSAEDLERPLTELQLHDESSTDVISTENSPIVAHLTRKSANMPAQEVDSSPESDENIVLPPTARAAADSAKLKRGLFTDLFPEPPAHKGNSNETTSSSIGSRPGRKPCPDTQLHQNGPAVRCPDPTAHFATQDTHDHQTFGHQSQHILHPHHPPQFGPMQAQTNFNHVAATGSPMPLIKAKPPPAYIRGPRPSSRCHHVRSDASTYSRPTFHESGRDHTPVTTISEHFEPGWYYARDSQQQSPRSGPPMYSFSTAAAKRTGQDPAPDSWIRDSYRTDTLTPLARPASRYRKNGISAIASARGAGKYYGGPSQLSRPATRRMHSVRHRLPPDMQFRSSPPRSSMDTARSPQPRKRSRELVSPASDIAEEVVVKSKPLDPRLKLEEGEEMIEVDEETRAAVRMSMFGPATPIANSEASGSLKDISPNVELYRKGTGPNGSRKKKRRPSYWDGDLAEVTRSPAARHVVPSPVKKEDVRSLQADIEFQDESDKENRSPTSVDSPGSDEARDITTMSDDILMEEEPTAHATGYY
jgi:hypothetical protein